MRAARTVLGVLLVLIAARGARADDRIDRLVADLRSPFLEVRENAARELALKMPRAAPTLREAYDSADFRTRAVILLAFAEGDPAEGIPLIEKDLAAADRGVFRAQLELVSALCARARAIIPKAVLPRLPFGDWALEEGIRALPTRAASARRALTRLATISPAEARALFARVEDVDRLRSVLTSNSGERAASPEAAARARALSRHLLRHDVERGLYAVHQAGGRDGAYEGMYRIVGEVFDAEGREVLDIVFAILTDREPPENGVPTPEASRYRFREPPPLGSGLLWIRKRAAYCLGDIGDRRAAAELAEYYETFTKGDLEYFDSPREDVAHACAALGETGPLREMIAEYEDQYLDDSEHSHLAGCYARLGDWAKAVVHFGLASEYEFDRNWLYHYNMACALARMGNPREALNRLRMAVQSGYGRDPSHLEWMERDGDLKSVREEEDYQRLVREIRAELSR